MLKAAEKMQTISISLLGVKKFYIFYTETDNSNSFISQKSETPAPPKNSWQLIDW